jgi:NADH-quinone oxidoreductase subunit M
MGPWFARRRDQSGRLGKLWALFASALTAVVLLAVAKSGLVVPGAVLQVEEVYPWISSLGVSFSLRLDGLSFAFCLLTCLVTLAVIGFSSKPSNAGAGWYASLLAGQSAVLGAFLASDLVLFYCFYELMLLPVIAAIALWGGAGRMNAALRFLLYTMVGSVLMFLAILYLGYRGFDILGAHIGSTDAPRFAFEISALATMPRLPIQEQIVLGLCFLIAFGVKIPVVPLHGWLASTYREAPHGTAAFTAALLGKVGVYAVIRFVMPLFPDFLVLAAPTIAALGALGVVYGALIALVQRDIRSLLAYSSLSHLGFCVLGIAAASEMALTGAVFQAISHGVVTAALFLIFGAIIDREGSGDFASLGGLARKLPVTAFFLMVFSVAAVALPLTSSFVGEFLVLIGSWSAFPMWTVLSMAGVVLGAVYTLTAYMKTMFGPAHDTVPLRRSDIRGGDALVLMSLVAAVVALGVAPGKLLSVVDSSLSTQLKMYRSDSRASVKDKVFREQQVGSDSVVQANTVAVVSDQDKAQAL